MRVEGYSETMSFGCTKETFKVKSKVVQKAEKRYKEAVLATPSMVPSSFASTIVCHQAPHREKKHFKNLTRMEPRNKAQQFSETCYLTPPANTASFETELIGGIQRTNNHYVNCLRLASRDRLERVHGLRLIGEMQSTKKVIASPST